jgi:hypothetical protein
MPCKRPRTVISARVASCGSHNHVARWFFMKSSDVVFPKTLPKHSPNTNQTPPKHAHIMPITYLSHAYIMPMSYLNHAYINPISYLYHLNVRIRLSRAHKPRLAFTCLAKPPRLHKKPSKCCRINLEDESMD